MRVNKLVQCRAAAVAAAMLGTLIALPSAFAAGAPEGGEAGFVVHGIGNALARPGQIDTMCPEGRSLGYVQIFEQTDEGSMEGYLAGYTPVEAMYDINYGFRNAKTDAGIRDERAGVTYLRANRC